MKKLSKDEMKKVVGGLVQPCCPNGSIAHCYGTTSNCTGSAWGDCPGGGSNCLTYCVSQGQSQYWC